MADPVLKKRFPEKDLNQVVAIAAMCLQEEPSVRPLIGDVVTTLSYIKKIPDEDDIDNSGFTSAEEFTCSEAEGELDPHKKKTKRKVKRKKTPGGSGHKNKTKSHDGSISDSQEGSSHRRRSSGGEGSTHRKSTGGSGSTRSSSRRHHHRHHHHHHHGKEKHEDEVEDNND